MDIFPVLTVRTRHPSETFWWIWLGGQDRPLRRVRSLEHVRWLKGEFDCVRVDWGGGSYQEMVRAGVAPADPPSWLE